MYYLGIDIAKYRHAASLINSEEKPLFEGFLFENSTRGYGELRRMFAKHHIEVSNVQIGLEASGPYWIALYEKLFQDGFQVFVLNPLLIHSHRNEDIRGNKTDKIDSVLIAKVLHRGGHIASCFPKEDLFSLRELSRFRTDLVDQIARNGMKILSLLDQVFPEYADLFSDLLGVTSLKILEDYTTPEEIAALDLDQLTAQIETLSRKKLRREFAQELQAQARLSFGVHFSLDAFGFEIQCLIGQVRQLKEQEKQLRQRIESILQAQPSAPALASVPGINIITAATILGEIGSFDVFQIKEGAEKLVALAGIDPKVKESGQYKGKPKMSKRGSPYLRRALTQAALVAARVDPMFESIYQKHRSKGKHHLVAVSHCARKLTHVIYSVVKNNRPYVCPILN